MISATQQYKIWSVTSYACGWRLWSQCFRCILCFSGNATICNCGLATLSFITKQFLITIILGNYAEDFINIFIEKKRFSFLKEMLAAFFNNIEWSAYVSIFFCFWFSVYVRLNPRTVLMFPFSCNAIYYSFVWNDRTTIK